MKSLCYLYVFPIFLAIVLGVMGCSSDDDSIQMVNIDGLKYYLYPTEAIIDNGNTWSGDLVIPSEVKHNGRTLAVRGMAYGAFKNCTTLTKVRIPNTIVHIVNHNLNGNDGAVSPDYMNPFAGCTVLESIEVDNENPIMTSVGGVLFNKDKTRLYCYPAGSRQEVYNIPESITWIGGDAFSYSQYLTTLSIPSSVTHICDGAFRWSSVKTLFIMGTFPDELSNAMFWNMDDATVIYVQPSEVEKFKKVFSGTVLPLKQ